MSDTPDYTDRTPEAVRERLRQHLGATRAVPVVPMDDMRPGQVLETLRAHQRGELVASIRNEPLRPGSPVVTYLVERITAAEHATPERGKGPANSYSDIRAGWPYRTPGGPE